MPSHSKFPQTPDEADYQREFVRLADRVGNLEKTMAERFDELEKSTKALVQAWETATGVLKFIKVIAGLATAVGGAWALLKAYWGH